MIIGLLGPNGAGKTTTLECLEGVRKAAGDTVEDLRVERPSLEARFLELVEGGEHK